MDLCELIYCYITHHTIFNHFSYSALYVFTPFSQVLCDVGRGMQYCKKYTEQELLAESIGRVSWLEYDITFCKYVRSLLFPVPIDKFSHIII